MMSCKNRGMLSNGVKLPDNKNMTTNTGIDSSANCGIEFATVASKIPSDVTASAPAATTIENKEPNATKAPARTASAIKLIVSSRVLSTSAFAAIAWQQRITMLWSNN